VHLRQTQVVPAVLRPPVTNITTRPDPTTFQARTQTITEPITTMASDTTASEPLITGLAHVNITIPTGTLPLAKHFYSNILGLTSVPVPQAQTADLAWFNIGTSGQQIHISHQKHDQDTIHERSSRHPCFKLAGPEALLALQRRILGELEKGGDGAPMAVDGLGQSSGPKGVEYPTRFFARDFGGNRLEFTL
jgi:hypothetical protein